MTARTQTQLQRAAVVRFAYELVAATLHRRMHAEDHPHVRDALQDFVAALRSAAAAGVEMPLRLQFDDDRLHYEGEPLDGPSLQAGALLRACRERQIAVLAFHEGLDAGECSRCLDLLLLPQNRDALARGQRDAVLRALGIRRVGVTLRTPADPGDRRAAVPVGAALHSYQDLAESLHQNHVRAHRDQELAVAEVQGVVERTLEQLEEPSLLLSLAAQDDVDRFTVGHSVRVALLALQVARAAGADRARLVHVGTAALLHDIGKSKVPQEILWKRGRLDEDEWVWMAQHPRLGAHVLLEQHEAVDPSAIGAAFCHHMGAGGAGYPVTAVPVVPSATSRLIRVCDVFEALTSVRPYKRALLPVEAFAVMCRNAADFDAHWLRRFAQVVGLFPTGSRVLLDDGADALVVRQGEAPHRPIVRLLTGPGGAGLPAGAPDLLALGVPCDGVVRRIAAASTHERCTELPEFDQHDPEILTIDPAQACLPVRIATDAAAAGGRSG